MTNPKGTAAETATVAWLQDNGYPHAHRVVKHGARDRGDVAPCPGVVIEVKNYAVNGAAARGAVPAGQLAEWMRQTEVERENARADVGILLVKRAGTTDVGRWFAYVTAWTLADIIYGSSTVVDDIEAFSALRAPVCLAMADLTTLLRAAGWGAPLEVAS